MDLGALGELGVVSGLRRWRSASGARLPRGLECEPAALTRALEPPSAGWADYPFRLHRPGAAWAPPLVGNVALLNPLQDVEQMGEGRRRCCRTQLILVSGHVADTAD